MSTLSRYPWVVSGTVTDPITSLPVTLNFAVDCPGPNPWTRTEPDAAKVMNPCTRQITMVLNGSGILVKRTAHPTFRIPNLPDRATMLANLRTIWRLRGPWSVLVPDYPGTEVITCMCDPTAGPYIEVPLGVLGLTVSFGLQEL